VGSAEECEAEARRILGLTVKGKPVTAVLLERAVRIAREFYLAVTLSRRDRCALLLFSTRGGVDIEQVAREAPEALLRAPIDPLLGLRDHQVRDVVAAAGLAPARGAGGPPAQGAGKSSADSAGKPSAQSAGTPPAQGAGTPPAAQLAAVLRGVWGLYRDQDATLVEVNPLVLTEDDGIVCLDSKVTIDGNALWRHEVLAALRDPGDEREQAARAAGVTYLSLDGDIGVLGNGAGMVMSTLDLIGAAGGRAADFCDVGGGARAAAVEGALRIILADVRVKAVLVSIFGGITRGDEVARGLIAALGEGGGEAYPPVVVRLDGNGADEGRALLAEACLPGVEAVADADAAVARAVELAAAAPEARP
jgi:succinyl-CoA synthetase beta subunit